MTRSRRLSALLGLIAFVGAGGGAWNDARGASGNDRSRGGAPKTFDYFQELQGTWRIVEQVENGRDISAEMRQNHWTVTRTGNAFVIRSGLGVFSSGTWTVDDSKDPVEIIQRVTKGQGAGKTRHIIIKFEGDMLCYCSGDETPDAFHSPPGRKLVNAKAIRVSAPGGGVEAQKAARPDANAKPRADMVARAAARPVAGARPRVDMVALERRASAGDAQSMYELGVHLCTGAVGVQDSKRGIAWLEKAANAGHAGAMNDLGCCYYYGKCVKKDVKLAREWLNKAAQAGCPEAQRAVAKAGGYRRWEDTPEQHKKLVIGVIAAAWLASSMATANTRPHGCDWVGSIAGIGRLPCDCNGFQKPFYFENYRDPDACTKCNHSESLHH